MTGFRINDNRRTFVLKPKVIRMYYCCCCQQKKISIYILLVCTVVKKWTVVFARLRTVLARVHSRTFANACVKPPPRAVFRNALKMYKPHQHYPQLLPPLMFVVSDSSSTIVPTAVLFVVMTSRLVHILSATCMETVPERVTTVAACKRKVN